jgi:hypothetical protein
VFGDKLEYQDGPVIWRNASIFKEDDPELVLEKLGIILPDMPDTE